jgi:GNAT superfamily N-acetyltransferase
MGMGRAMTHSIRTAQSDDAPELARLLTSLGHPTATDEIVARWDAWREEGNTALVAARVDGSLAGVATLHVTIVLHRPRPVGRITSLVVDEGARGKGIGRALVAAAEQVLAEAGCGMVEVTSNARREDAHAFYRHIGYEQTSARFMKLLRE